MKLKFPTRSVSVYYNARKFHKRTNFVKRKILCIERECIL